MSETRQIIYTAVPKLTRWTVRRIGADGDNYTGDYSSRAAALAVAAQLARQNDGVLVP